MRLRNKPWAKEKIENNPETAIVTPGDYKGKWHEVFGNKNPIHIEVGSGRGRFIVGMALANPEINYIAIEKFASVAVDILDKILEENIKNIKVMNVDATDLPDYFKHNEVDCIYLNFSDPWPKTRHEKRRLTHHTFLKMYREIMVEDGEIRFKTDNRGLFEFSLASMSQYGMTLQQVWLDLHKSDFEGNIMTEYEEKFSSKGNPIYRLEAVYKK